MQKLAIHLQHYKRGQVAKLGAEGQRHISNTLDNRIDFSQSKYNFQAITGERAGARNYTRELRKICASNGITEQKKGKRVVFMYGNGKSVRKDANVMTGIVVTLSRETVEEWGIAKAQEYFRECALFLKEKFGNCIDDVVHTDETGAGWHLHFYACPIIKGSFNSKGMWGRTALIELHNDLAEHLQAKGFDVTRGEANTGIDYKESYKDYKRELAPVIRSVEKIEQALGIVKESAVHHNASKGFMGIGASDAKVELTPKQYTALLRLAEQGKSATIELAENRKRIDQSKKLQQAEQEKAILWSDAEGYKAENEKLKQELKALPARVVQAYIDKNKATLQAGYELRLALKDEDFAYNFNRLYKEYKERQQARQLRDKQKKLRDVQRVRTRNKDREDRGRD